MIVTSKGPIKKTLKVTWFFQLFTYCSPQFFLPDTATILLTWHVI